MACVGWAFKGPLHKPWLLLTSAADQWVATLSADLLLRLEWLVIEALDKITKERLIIAENQMEYEMKWKLWTADISAPNFNWWTFTAMLWFHTTISNIGQNNKTWTVPHAAQYHVRALIVGQYPLILLQCCFCIALDRFTKKNVSRQYDLIEWWLLSHFNWEILQQLVLHCA